MENLISIIVPVYNVELYLDKCMESIVNQTYKNLEIILIDDGSTDDSGKKCDEWARKDNRIKVIHKENGGVSSARNVGLEMAKGEYIGFVDSDDFIDENMYEMMHREIKKDEIDLVICGAKQITFNEKVELVKTEEYSYQVINQLEMFQKFYPLYGTVWNCLFIKNKLNDIKFNTKMYTAEDLNFVCHYILRCEGSGIVVKRDLYYYVRRETSTTKANNFKIKRLKFHTDTLDAVKCTEAMIIENCNQEEIKSMIKTKTIYSYWNVIYALLNEKLVDDYELIEKYNNELKEYKKYYSMKDKGYRILLGISPKLFEVVYRNIKRVKSGIVR